jgi:hypothetical protein
VCLLSRLFLFACHFRPVPNLISQTSLSFLEDECVAPVYDPRTKHLGTIRLEISYVRLGSVKGLQLRRSGWCTKKRKSGLYIACVTPFDLLCSNEPGFGLGRAVLMNQDRYGQSERIERSKASAVTTAPYDPEDPGPAVVFMFRSQ